MHEPATASQGIQHRVRWKWFLALGVILLVLGIAGVSVASLLELASVLVFAPLLLASSLVQLLTAFFAETGREKLLQYAAAVLEMFLGFFIMANPLQSVVSLAVLIAICLIVVGLARLARSLETRSRGRGWIIVAGVVALLLGICVWTGWPVAKPWFVGLCIAVDFICHGVSWSALALAERKTLQVPAARDAR